MHVSHGASLQVGVLSNVDNIEKSTPCKELPFGIKA